MTVTWSASDLVLHLGHRAATRDRVEARYYENCLTKTQVTIAQHRSSVAMG